MALTRLEALVDLVGGGLVTSETNDREFGLDHTCTCVGADHDEVRY